MSHAEVQAFFARYRDAFDRLDGDAVADLWHVPSGIADSPATAGGWAGGGRLTWWPDDAPMRANHRALCALYRGAGYHRARFEIEASWPLGAHHAAARLRWTLTRADGSLLQRFHTAYQLIDTASGPKVLLCTAYEENLQEMTPHAAQ